MHVSKEQIENMDKYFRINFVNSLSGFKSANMIGTKNKDGLTNLALFSSVIHVGANPPLMGLLFRPVTSVRNTYDNIKSTRHFTINHVRKSIYKQAHQTSARYDKDISEFRECGFTEEYTDKIYAPYVKESEIKIGLEYVEEHEIRANSTIFMVGKIIEVILPEEIIGSDGYVDIEKSDTVVVTSLDGYHQTTKLNRLKYAKPEK